MLPLTEAQAKQVYVDKVLKLTIVDLYHILFIYHIY